ncbi:MAG TPA: hypothetical protein VFH61_18610 [Thermoleophilia bacterium]|nr:hypothetical protein [Thermoleophilia bacterium]
MPLLNIGRRNAQQAGDAGEVGRLDYRIGNPNIGQGVFLTGSERQIQTNVQLDADEPTFKHMLANNIDVAAWLALEGRVFYAGDADQNDTVTGQTSFADTTPTLLIDVPAGTVCIPLLVSLGQTGSVAGAAISMIVEIDKIKRYASAGTAEAKYNSRSDSGRAAACIAYSNPTAAAGYGQRLMGITVAPDVSPAEGIPNELIWTPSGPDLLVGPASFLIYTYATTTGPTWFWALKWAELPTNRLGF